MTETVCLHHQAVEIPYFVSVRSEGRVAGGNPSAAGLITRKAMLAQRAFKYSKAGALTIERHSMRQKFLTIVRNLIIRAINLMPGSLTLLNGLPRYEVFLEEAKRFPGLDASACYTYLQLLRTGDELLALDEQVLTSYGTRHGRFNLLMMLLHCSDGEATPAGLAD